MIYRLTLIDEVEKNVIECFKKKHTEVVGRIYELYDDLIMFKNTESYNRPGILYVGYTLAEKDIDFKIEEIN